MKVPNSESQQGEFLPERRDPTSSLMICQKFAAVARHVPLLLRADGSIEDVWLSCKEVMLPYNVSFVLGKRSQVCCKMLEHVRIRGPLLAKNQCVTVQTTVGTRDPCKRSPGCWLC